jgi:hypothetical protein
MPANGVKKSTARKGPARSSKKDRWGEEFLTTNSKSPILDVDLVVRLFLLAFGLVFGDYLANHSPLPDRNSLLIRVLGLVSTRKRRRKSLTCFPTISVLRRIPTIHRERSRHLRRNSSVIPTTGEMPSVSTRSI